MTSFGEGSAYPIRSVDRVCDILDALANSQSGVTLTAVAEAVSLPKSSAFRYLSALEARHYVERDPESVTYRLGPAFRPQYSHRVSRLIEFARPELERLRDSHGESTNLGILDGTMVVHSVVCESRHTMRLAARVGDREHVHATALGKAMCAQLPPERVRSILDAAGMPALTSAAITDPDAFRRELDRVRDQGYAVDDEENQPDGRCVAVSIPRLPFPAGISVSAPASRFRAADVAPTAARLHRIAAALSRRMKE